MDKYEGRIESLEPREDVIVLISRDALRVADVNDNDHSPILSKSSKYKYELEFTKSKKRGSIILSFYFFILLIFLDTTKHDLSNGENIIHNLYMCNKYLEEAKFNIIDNGMMKLYNSIEDEKTNGDYFDFCKEKVIFLFFIFYIFIDKCYV